MRLNKPSKCLGCSLEHEGGFVPPLCSCAVCNQQNAPQNTILSGEGRFGDGEGCQADLFIIAPSPDRHDCVHQTPFVGPTGRMLDGVFKPLDDTKICKAFLVNCRTTAQGKTGLVSRLPTLAEVRFCATRWLIPRLNNNLEAHILGLGPLVLRILSGGDQGTPHDSLGQRLERVSVDLTKAGQKRFKQPDQKLCECGGFLPPRRRKCQNCRKT